MASDGRVAHLMPIQNLIIELVGCASRVDVRYVMVKGQLLIDNGEFTSIDREKLSVEATIGAACIR